ncbi:MAG: SDR family oxidoreductase [Pseudobdellovibrionaceae bacterium]
MDNKGLVIVTGAGTGIGRAIAKEFSQRGYPLLLLDRSGKASELNLPQSISAKVDVSDLNAFSEAVKMAEFKFGPTDCLINNAGLMLLGQLETQDPIEWTQMMNVNVLGVLNGIKSVLGGMIERRSGSIINISSIAGKKTFPDHAAYCATKFAVHALTENLRQETAKHGLRCITIAPGVVETALLSHTTSESIKEAYKDWKKQIGGGLDPHDIAKAVLFAYEQPQNVCIREIVIAPTNQEP